MESDKEYKFNKSQRRKFTLNRKTLVNKGHTGDRQYSDINLEFSQSKQSLLRLKIEQKFSKHQRRKFKRYGKLPLKLRNPDDHQNYRTHPEPTQFIQSLVRPKIQEDHSLDELEHKKRHWPELPGSFETGKRR